MTAALTTAGVNAINGGAAFNEDLIHEIRFGTSQAAPVIAANGVVTNPTALRTPVSGAAAWDIAAVRSTDGRIFLFRSPAGDLARAFTAYEIGIFNSAGAMVAYESGGTTALLNKLADVEGWHNIGLVLSGLASAPPNPSFTTAMPIPATENLAGLVELANATEVAAGTDGTRVITPLGAAGHYAPLADAALTGSPTAPTPSVTGGIANKGYVDAKGVNLNFQRFTASGTWTKPAGVSVVRVQVIGGGQGGGLRGSLGTDAQGGYAGVIAEKWFRAIDLPDAPATVPITVGGGGTGSATPGVLVGGNGGESVFNNAGNANGIRGFGGMAQHADKQPYSRGGSIIGRSGSDGVASPSVNQGVRGRLGGMNQRRGRPGRDDPLGLGSGGGAAYAGSVGGAGQAPLPGNGGNGGVPGGGGGAAQGDIGQGARGGNGGRGEVRVWAW